MLNKNDLEKLKGHANSFEELEAYAYELGINCKKEELKEVYDSLHEVNEGLDEVSGGGFFGQPIGPRHCKFYCEHCGGKIKDGTENGGKCPHCGKWSRWHKENEYSGC